jgi:UDP-glucose 4-epimerase
MKWLITGGCGFLGTSLLHSLVPDGGHSFRVLDNLTVGTRDDLAEVVDFIELDPTGTLPTPEKNICQLIVGDIRNQKTASLVAKDMDVIIHFAANTGVPASVDNPPYGASKLAGEGYCSSYFKTFGIDTVALRFGNVYGPGSKHKSSVVAKFIKKAINGRPLEVYGDGTQTRDFIYIDDLVEAVLKAAMLPGIGGEIFQIATNKETTVSEVLDLLAQVLLAEGIQCPEVVMSSKRPGDVMRNYSDTSKAMEKLKWQPKVELNVGLKKTIPYFLR